MHTQGEARNAVRARIVRASAHPTRVFLVEQAINELGVEAELEKVTDIGQITSFGVMMTPALAVDGEVKVVGKIASPEEIKAVLRDHFATVETVGHANQIVFEQDVVFFWRYILQRFRRCWHPCRSRRVPPALCSRWRQRSLGTN